MPRTTRPVVEQAGRVTWNTTVAGLPYYRYKTGPEAITDCRSPLGYGPVIELAVTNKIDEPVPETPGGYYLCVVGGSSPALDSTWQEPRLAVFRHGRIDTTPPILKPPMELADQGESYRLSFGFIPPGGKWVSLIWYIFAETTENSAALDYEHAASNSLCADRLGLPRPPTRR